jgi:uncharacterized protein YaeQ
MRDARRKRAAVDRRLVERVDEAVYEQPMEMPQRASLRVLGFVEWRVEQVLDGAASAWRQGQYVRRQILA